MVEKYYQPEIGQAIFGNPTGSFALSQIGEAVFQCIWERLKVYYCNKNQREMDFYGNDDPQIPGLIVLPYHWGDCDCDENKPHKEGCLKVAPNFVFDGIEIRWYKYPGRGMSCNQNLTPQQWSNWLEKILKTIEDNSPKEER